MKQKYIYIAGYIDGDGCFFLQKRKQPIKYQVKIIISSTNINLLNFVKDSFKGTIKALKIYNVNWKPQFHWYITGNKAIEFLKNFENFLIERKQEAIIFRKFHKSKNKKIKEELMQEMKNYRHLDKSITQEVFEDIKKTTFKNNFTEEDAAYLAGFTDAECCLSIAKYKRKNSPNYIYKIILSCNNTSPNIFYWLMEKIGGSITFISRKEKNPKHRNQINWNISGSKLFEILKKIHPFLRSKKEVCEKLMEFQQFILKNGGDRQSEEFKSSYTKIISKKEKIVDEVHKLNLKGQ